MFASSAQFSHWGHTCVTAWLCEAETLRACPPPLDPGSSQLSEVRLFRSPSSSEVNILLDLLDMPRSHYPLTHTKWLREYGPLTYLVAMGQPILVINSLDMAKDLLDKKGSNYINRPRMVMAGELCSEFYYFPGGS